MIENQINHRPRVFSEDSADVPWLTAKIIDGERYNVMFGASYDEFDDGDHDDTGSVDSWAGDEESVRSGQQTRKSRCRPRLGMVVLPSFVFFMSIFILIRQLYSFARWFMRVIQAVGIAVVQGRASTGQLPW